MRICPTCRTAYPARGRATCANDGTRLVGAEEFAASKNDPLLGRLVAGRFQVIERIGTGGMGTVYRAEQSGLDRPVALKVLKSELVSDRETVARFHREAKAMSMLMHPNTVRVFDFGEDEEGHLFLAMELLEGELLTAWIEREGTPPIEQAMRTIQEILRSLAEAHSKGIIHRDLKPDNIFLARVEGHSRPVVKVLDFGIAKVFREDHQIDQLETQAGTVFGTPRYMSPEQAQGKTLDHRSDLYTVGTLLYQLLTGQPPFVDDDAVVVMAKHIRETPPSPRMAVPERPIPRSLDKLAMRALGKEPDDRFENAEQMEARLMACLPDVEREAAGRGGGLLGGLPKLPLAIGGHPARDGVRGHDRDLERARRDRRGGRPGVAASDRGLRAAADAASRRPVGPPRQRARRRARAPGRPADRHHAALARRDGRAARGDPRARRVRADGRGADGRDDRAAGGADGPTGRADDPGAGRADRATLRGATPAARPPLHDRVGESPRARG